MSSHHCAPWSNLPPHKMHCCSIISHLQTMRFLKTTKTPQNEVVLLCVRIDLLSQNDMRKQGPWISDGTYSGIARILFFACSQIAHYLLQAAPRQRWMCWQFVFGHRTCRVTSIKSSSKGVAAFRNDDLFTSRWASCASWCNHKVKLSLLNVLRVNRFQKSVRRNEQDCMPSFPTDSERQTLNHRKSLLSIKEGESPLVSDLLQLSASSSLRSVLGHLSGTSWYRQNLHPLLALYAARRSKEGRWCRCQRRDQPRRLVESLQVLSGSISSIALRQFIPSIIHSWRLIRALEGDADVRSK